MIARVIILTPEGTEVPCHLAGFGMTVCGNCNQVLKSIHPGSRCLGCGGTIITVSRKGGTSFEGEHT